MNIVSNLGPDNLIEGVEIKLLKSHGDERGFFREVIRRSDSLFKDGAFAQWSHSRMVKNTVKAWHYHHVQFDWWYVPMGKVQTVLFDNRSESSTYKHMQIFQLGETEKYGPETLAACVRIPPGVLHGCRVLSEDAHLFYITSETYDPKDEGRFPFNDPVVPFNWGEDAITVENDRRAFVPAHARTRLAN